jgi:hypothetical protein
MIIKRTFEAARCSTGSSAHTHFNLDPVTSDSQMLYKWCVRVNGFTSIHRTRKEAQSYLDMTVPVIQRQRAIDWALGIAHQDQEDYLMSGDMRLDYGSEWKDTARQKAANCRALAAFEATTLGGDAATNRWMELANDFEGSTKNAK